MSTARCRFATRGRFVPGLLVLEARDLPSLLAAPNLPNLAVGPRPAFSMVDHVQSSPTSGAAGSYVVHDALANDAGHAIVEPTAGPALLPATQAGDGDADHDTGHDDGLSRMDPGALALHASPSSQLDGDAALLGGSSICIGVFAPATPQHGSSNSPVPVASVPSAVALPNNRSLAASPAGNPQQEPPASTPDAGEDAQAQANIPSASPADAEPPPSSGLLTVRRALDPGAIGHALEHFLHGLETQASGLLADGHPLPLVTWVCAAAFGGGAVGAALHRWRRADGVAPPVSLAVTHSALIIRPREKPHE
jgi:hypothetical protein